MNQFDYHELLSLELNNFDLWWFWAKFDHL